MSSDKKILRAMICLFVFGFAAASFANVPGPVSEVRMHNGIPAMFVDGEPFVTPIFETYVPKAKHFKQFSEAGSKAFGFACNAANEPWEHSRAVWVGPNVWDFSEFDRNVRKILSADPNAWIMPRVHVAEPDWWREANPSELMVYSDGTMYRKNPFRLWPGLKERSYASIASKKWREDMAHSLRRLIDHIQCSDYAKNILGYHVYGLNTEEWYHIALNEKQLGDYSDNMKLDFQQWLKRKYWTKENLQKSWNDSGIDFHLVEIPSAEDRLAGKYKLPFRDPAKYMHVIDFYQYYNEIIPETIDYLCSVVKEATNRQKIVGAFYAYMFEFGGRPETGHMAVGKLLESSNIDFIAVTASYGHRQLGSGGSILRSPHTSLKLHGKLWFEDNDNVTFLFPEVSMRMGDAEWERSKEVLAATDTAEETKWILQRGAGFTLGNGLHQSFFDLHGGYFDHEQIMADVADIYKMFERSVDADLTSPAEILVIADEVSCMYATQSSRLLAQNLYDPPYRLIKCGAPYDAVYVDDLDKLDMSPYKLCVVLNAFHLTSVQRELLQQRVMNDDRTVLWIYAPGLFEGNTTDIERVSKMTGMKVYGNIDGPIQAPRIKLQWASGTFVQELNDADFREIGSGAKTLTLFTVDDEKAISLGVDPKTEQTVLAQKDMGDWTSVYSITASLPPDFYRAIARQAGVHLYNERNDTLYVSRGYLTINADGEGQRKILLPGKANVYDAITEELLVEKKDKVKLKMRDKETRILRFEYVK